MSHQQSDYLIVIIVAGIYEEIPPYIALAVGLQHAGYRIRLVMPDFHVHHVHPHQLDVWSMSHAARTHDADIVLHERMQSTRLASFFCDAMIGWSTIALSACRGAHLVISGLSTVFMAQSISEKLRIPYVPAYITPIHQTTTQVHPLMSRWWEMLGSTGVELSYRLFAQRSWHAFSRADAMIRRQVFELPRRILPPNVTASTSQSVIYGISPTLWSKPRDWESHLHLTGVWQPAICTWHIPATLEAFIRSGSPPVVISLTGDASLAQRTRITHIINAIIQRGERVVLWSNSDPITAPSHMYYVLDAPVAYEQLLPHMKLIVHDGSTQATVAAAAIGVPQMLLPSQHVHYFWARQAMHLGIAPFTPSLMHLTEAQCSTAVHHALTSPHLHQQVRSVRSRMRREDGIGHTRDVIRSLIMANQSR